VRRVLPACAVGAAVAFATAGCVNTPSRTHTRASSIACFKQHHVKVDASVPDAVLIPKTLHAYFTRFPDSELYTFTVGLPGLPTDTAPSNLGGFIVFASSVEGRKKAERAWIAALRHPMTPEQAGLEPHGVAFAQWAPAPKPHSKDRAIITACLGPTSARS
jgi:hypothetical protein